MIKIISVWDSDKHFDKAIFEYQKRLGKSVELIPIKPVKWESIENTIKFETKKILDKLKKYPNFHKIILNKSWKLVDSHYFSQFFPWNNNTAFILGGPYGLNTSLLYPSIQQEISFWKITLPHWIAKLVLLEQLYRWYTISINKSYHY